MKIFDFVKNDMSVKKRDSVLELKYEEVVNYPWFYKYISKNIILGYKYSLLIRVSYSNEDSGDYTEYKMLGNQLSIFAETEMELEDVICDTYNVIIQRLASSVDNYNYNSSDVINFQFLIFSVGDKAVIKSNKLTGNYLGNQKDLVNISKVSDSYKFSELINNPFDLGKPLYKSYYNGILQYITLNDGNILDIRAILGNDKLGNLCNGSTKFYERKVDGVSYLLIVNELSKSKIIHIYTFKGSFVNKISYEYLTNKTYSRTTGNVTVYVGDKGIFKSEIGIKFPSVYPYKLTEKKKSMTDPDWKIGTMDLETYNYKDISKTYAIGFYTKNSVNTYYIDESLDSDSLIIKCIDSMLVDKYNGYTFYIHNLRKFDVYFLFRVLLMYSNKYTCKPYFRDDGVIGMKISSKTTKKTYSIKIVDSRNFFSESLDKLCKSFDTPIKKSYFPYNFVNENTIFYVGKKPDFSYYKNVDENKSMPVDLYNEIPTEDWDLENETLIYLKNDLISLFNVIEQFTRKVYINYNTHVTSSMTISSLSMDIFLRKYYNGNNIPLIKQKSVYKDIKSSYYGGVTEVYKPYGKNLFYYDVNSLYPYSALNYMPGRECKYIDNINESLSSLDDPFGFFYCKVTASNNYIGLLPYRSEEGLTMPVGEFEGWYFSEELKFAQSKGYNIQVIKGYYFNRVSGVFDSYVRELYKVKYSTKDEVERQIVKSLLNNLLGRFGLDINKYTTSLLSYDEFRYVIQSRKVRSVKFIEDRVLACYEKDVNKHICESHSIDFKDATNKPNLNNNSVEDNYHDVSVAISSCITAYSRIYMNKIKLDILNKGGNIYYTDTDSIVTDLELGGNIVGEGLGAFKLEHKIKEGYFISNKTYGILRDDNKVVIKNKGIHKGGLTFDKLQSLYLGNEVESKRYETVKSFTRGSAVLFVENKVILQPNSYNKRVKVFDKSNFWVDTKPISKGYHTTTSIKKRSITFNKLYLSILLLISISIGVYIMVVDYTSSVVVFDLPIYVEPDLSVDSNNKSFLWDILKENFIDKFKYRGNKLYINKSVDIINSIKFNYVTHTNEVKVLDNVLLSHIDEIVKDNDNLRDKMSIMQLELEREKINKLDRIRFLDAVIKEVDTFVSNNK